jgi:AbrB family looped-hinge helix DNA binding protein
MEVLKIDKAGRIVVPKPMRERLGFSPESELLAVERPDGVLIKRAEEQPTLVEVGGLLVHQGRAEPGAQWDRVIDSVREERLEAVLKH